MPSAILDVEATDLPATVSAPGPWRQARLLVRVAGRPAAWIDAPVQDGLVTAQALAEALVAQAPWSFWQALAAAQVALAQTPDVAGEPLPSATVAICTRDRPDDLRRCLAGLARLPDEGQEILVIDSASQLRGTRSVVDEFAADLPTLRYVRLEQRGLNRARNAALTQARGEIVAFIDDDAVPDAGWLTAHRRAFASPLTLASTGLTLPLELETDAQEQFEIYGGFGRGFLPRTFQVANLHPLAAGRAGAGVNMALRREVVTLIGPFDEALDAGTPTCSGGEAELFARILAQHYRIEYTPAALNWHRHRRTLPELRATVRGYGVGVYAFWTARLLAGAEPGAPLVGWQWFWRDQLPRLLRSMLRRPGALAWPLPADELRGCLAGPGAYLRSRRLARQEDGR